MTAATRHDRAQELPEDIEELLGYVLRHLASELRVDECPAPLAESLRTYTRAVMRADRDLHEHPTPLVNVENRTTPRVQISNAGTETHEAQPTLPTEPPPGVSFDDPPATGRTSRGFPRAT